MKFHVFFLTITIQKKTFSDADILHDQQIKIAMDEVKERQTPYSSHL
ncbi:YrzI family small protein [Bacillus gaemokensis]|uniref:Sporulation protein n=1 Tax=Bacillus gaemokensis TaxID=574375 RepID=A0A073K8R6_9BACI|nr:YrzI family small protein [Bacillus gaemokensis]KEK22920.1 sporulation protein [Bacillus gaemokensis]KYG34719.1 sporulation protein [Bacillus gaemokensis]